MMPSIKELFIEYLKGRSADGSGKPQSYAKAMQVIEDVLFDERFSESFSIWEFVNDKNVDKIYEYVRIQQNLDDGIFKNYEPKSYWKKNYCSAALKEFKEYLSVTLEANIEPHHIDDCNATEFTYDSNNAGLIFSEQVSSRLISSLLAKPFAILTGLSGSGKTKLAEAFSLWICEKDNQICIVSVGADWTNREPLLGFPNSLKEGYYVKPDSGVLDLLIEAQKEENKDRPYFLILDEMNMSHVERYFADFLSAMESVSGEIALHPDTDDWEGCDVPATIKLPKNLFIIGTVNIDETTYMFSPKVLDRANVIEFRVSENEMKSYFTQPTELDLDSLKGKGVSMAESFVAKSYEKGLMTQGLEKKLIPFFTELQKVGAEFGYRTASEISRFVKICEDMKGGTMKKNEIIDAAIIQKLLPKLHGSRSKIEKVLKILISLCETDDESKSVKYTLSHEKLNRMHQRIISDGFTSFAEA